MELGRKMGFVGICGEKWDLLGFGSRNWGEKWDLLGFGSWNWGEMGFGGIWVINWGENGI